MKLLFLTLNLKSPQLNTTLPLPDKDSTPSFTQELLNSNPKSKLMKPSLPRTKKLLPKKLKSEIEKELTLNTSTANSPMPSQLLMNQSSSSTDTLTVKSHPLLKSRLSERTWRNSKKMSLRPRSLKSQLLTPSSQLPAKSPHKTLKISDKLLFSWTNLENTSKSKPTESKVKKTKLLQLSTPELPA